MLYARETPNEKNEERRDLLLSVLKDMGSEMFDYVRYLLLSCPSTCAVDLSPDQACVVGVVFGGGPHDQDHEEVDFHLKC